MRYVVVVAQFAEGIPQKSSICCGQSAVTMWVGARLASCKLTLFTRCSTTSRTTDSEYLFWAEFLFHGEIMISNPSTGMVNLDQF